MKKLNKKQKLIIFISIVTIIVIIGVVIGVNIIKTNIANGNYESSNSESNNRNLLPEYIKKGITLGGVTGTLESLDTSDATATPEDILYGKTAYVDGVKITGTRRSLDMLNIGDYVEYIPDTASPYTGISTDITGISSNPTSITQEELDWQILSINDDGTVDLISSETTVQELHFMGSIAYNNGVVLLNDVIAKLYSNKELGVTARSIKIEDIEKHMSSTGLEFINNYASEKGIKVGETNTYTGSNSYYPSLYENENGSGINTTTIKKDGVNQSDNYYSTPSKISPAYKQASTNGLTVTQTYYTKEKMTSDYYDSNEFYKLIHTDSYWLASRFVDTDANNALFRN